MAFVIITGSIENTIESLDNEMKAFDRLFKQTNKSKYRIKRDMYKDKLNVALRYKKLWDQRDEYDKIKHLKAVNLKEYIKHCAEIVKDVRGVTFCKKTLRFRVRITIDKVRKSLGEFDTPQDALEILQMYV